MRRRPCLQTSSIMIIAVLCSCGDTGSSGAISQPDPDRCTVRDFGEATELLKKDPFPDDILVRIHGIGHPQALVWRNSETNRSYFITRVMGTGQLLFYLKEISDGPPPGVPSQFVGHLTRWSTLPKTKSEPIAVALDKKYAIKVDRQNAFVIDNTSRPAGCPQ